jgi:ATP-dependent DNA helicase RecG
MVSLKSNIRNLGGIYKRYAAPLEKLGIISFGDFLYHIPFRYDDFTLISTISQIQPGEVVTIRGEVEDFKNQYTRGRFTIQRAKVRDETGTIEVVWFNQPYLTKNISTGDKISLSGKVDIKVGKLQLGSPDYEIGETNFIHTGRLVPIYPETRGVSSKWIRRQTYKILEENEREISDFLPEEIRNKNKLEGLYEALRKVHFPNTLEEAAQARKRLGFDELFTTQLSANLRRIEWNKELKSQPFETKKFRKHIDEFVKKLPFKLTGAQERTVSEIFFDLEKTKPMNRLLEGDVGSGKTVVATISMYLGHLNGMQSVLMAPTEILATQHFNTISSLLTPFGIKIAFATGSKKQDLDEFDILVGTHAVIQKDIDFKRLGLIVIDEQQRFGVEQRGILRKKGNNPHVLTMTATPIPRTIALTLYGDLDLSVLDEMPMGRREIKTWLTPNSKREDAYDWIKKQIDKNKSQVFIICPFIDESESMQSVKAATKEFESLRKVIFKKYKVALLHGKLKAKEKETVLMDFKNREYDILVATPVVEVGIDIPNADIIIIEASDRFGLSQLHQLRGRVGRNDKQAYCLLFTESKAPQTIQRLKAMETTNIGAKLAELDLKMRGPGEIYGTRQSGRSYLKVASFSDFELIKTTKAEAERIAPHLSKYPALKEKIEEINPLEVNPD